MRRSLRRVAASEIVGVLHAEKPNGFSRLPARGRFTLFAVVGAVGIVDVALNLADPMVTWSDVTIALLAAVATLLFAWWPAAAATCILAVTLAQIASAESGGQILYAAAVTGLVVYTSPAWFSIVYAGAVALIGVLAWRSTELLTDIALPALVVVGAVSGLIGSALKIAHSRERRLSCDLARLNAQRSEELTAERERIADELHDIIAHDVTLVAMHARVLERIHDEGLRARSVTAIRDSADQALADIRRVLRIVRDGRVVSKSDSMETEEKGTETALRDANHSLDALGARTVVDMSAGLTVSSSIENAIVHIIREGATNIAKHGAPTPDVHLRVKEEGDEVIVELTNSVLADATVEASKSSGYGIDRLRERVGLLGGTLTVQLDNDTWLLSARLPRY